jgi:hypothetical protein
MKWTTASNWPIFDLLQSTVLSTRALKIWVSFLLFLQTTKFYKNKIKIKEQRCCLQGAHTHKKRWGPSDTHSSCVWCISPLSSIYSCVYRRCKRDLQGKGIINFQKKKTGRKRWKSLGHLFSFFYSFTPTMKHTSKARKTLLVSFSLLVQSPLCIPWRFTPLFILRVTSAHLAKYIRRYLLYIYIYIYLCVRVYSQERPSVAHTYLNTFVTVRPTWLVLPHRCRHKIHREKDDGAQRTIIIISYKYATAIHKGRFLMANRRSFTSLSIDRERESRFPRKRQNSGPLDYTRAAI